MTEILSSNPSLGDVEEISAYYMNRYLEIKRPALFGYCLDILLYGFLTVQIYFYHLAFPDDKKLTKMTVYLVYAVGSIQTAFALRDFYGLFCIPVGFAQVESSMPNLHTFGFMWLTIPASSTLVAVIVQLFYAQRIWIVSHSKSIAPIVAFLACLQLSCGVYSAILVYGSPPMPLDVDSFLGASGVDIVNALGWGLAGALCDLVIAVFMFVYISKQTKRTSKVTQRSLLQIKRLLLETGLLTVVAAVSYMLLSSFFNSTTFYMIPGLVLSKLYGNSMLAVLNNRALIDKGRYASRTASISFYEPSVATRT